MNFKKGLTMAELLTTITIIGVVAALTIPPLITSYQETLLKTNVKKANYMLSGMLTKMIFEKKLPNFSATGSSTDFRNKFCDQLNCIETGLTNEFFAPLYKLFKNNTSAVDFSANTALSGALDNSMVIRFVNYKNNCTTVYGSLTTTCGHIHLDTNGTKGPNMMGKDFILFWVIKEDETYKILPGGIEDDNYTCVSPAIDWAHSLGCTAYYIQDKELP